MTFANEEPLNLPAIQSEVLRGYRRTHADAAPKHGAYVLVRFREEVDGAWRQAFLNGIPVTSADDWRSDQTRINVGFTYAGLELLLGSLAASTPSMPEVLASVGTAFDELKETMTTRAEGLGDVGASAPTHWAFSDGEAGGFGGIHLVAMVFGPSAQAVRAQIDQIRTAATDVAELHVEQGTELDERREHFGYVDGISQPAITGLEGRTEGYGTLDEAGRWRKINAGELVLGYDDEEGPFAGSPFLRDGTFFVLRKLEQDVEGFHDYLRDASELSDIRAAAAAKAEPPKDWLAARVMGRGFDGTPLLGKSPEDNNFRYASDNTGFECPFGAHIRRVNPRDVVGRIADRSERHRLVRRTLTYAEDGQGTPIAEEQSFGQRLHEQKPIREEERQRKRGMLFGCFNASIGRQFEVIQGGWLNGGEGAPGRLFTLRDPIAGANHNGKGDFIIPGRPLVVLKDIKRFTTTRGGAYFFVPSVPTYRALAHRVDRTTASARRTAVKERPPTGTDDVLRKIPDYLTLLSHVSWPKTSRSAIGVHGLPS